MRVSSDDSYETNTKNGEILISFRFNNDNNDNNKKRNISNKSLHKLYSMLLYELYYIMNSRTPLLGVLSDDCAHHIKFQLKDLKCSKLLYF